MIPNSEEQRPDFQEPGAPPGGQRDIPPPRPASLEGRDGFPSQFARLFFGVLILLVFYYTYEIIKPYLTDIFLALVLYFVARPLYQGLTVVLFGRRTLASLLTCVLLALIIVVPLLTLVGIVASQALEFSSQISHGLKDGTLMRWLEGKMALLKAYLDHLNLPFRAEELKMENFLRTILTGTSTFIYARAIDLLSGFTSFVINLVLILLVAFFLFLQGEDFIAEIKRLSPLSPADNEMILREMEATIKATLWSTVVVAVIQGVLGGLGFFLFGVPQAAFWGTVMIPASILPVVGSAIIWVPAVVYVILTKGWLMGLGLLLYCGLFIGSVDNLLKPLLMRGGRAIPTIFVLLAIMGGISYFGMIGFILGPFILSLFLSLLSIYEKAILAPLRAGEGEEGSRGQEAKRAIPPSGDGP